MFYKFMKLLTVPTTFSECIWMEGEEREIKERIGRVNESC